MQKTYSINQIAQKSGLTEDAIGYYEKIGLLPYAKRKENSHRYYDESDVETMVIIQCLKKTGMSLNEIKKVMQYPFKEKIQSVPALTALLLEYKTKILIQIDDLQRILMLINSKLEDDTTLFPPIDQHSFAASNEKRPPY